jgi:hypothetical protein
MRIASFNRINWFAVSLGEKITGVDSNDKLSSFFVRCRY